MSVSQATLTDRTPNILNKELTDKKPKRDISAISLKHEFDPTGLVQRCVIIQRDENGFGLTVSGDNPVFVQLVKEDGAAMRAGVQTGDRIIKVNGTLVTHSNHIEVVKLIKSGSYVALTVLGRPPGLPHIPLEEEKEEQEGVGETSTPSTLSASHPSELSGGVPSSPHDPSTSSVPDGFQDGASWSRNGEDEEGDGGPPFREQASPSQGEGGPCVNNSATNSRLLPERKRKTPCHSPDFSRRDGLDFCPSPDSEDAPDTDSSAHSIVGSPPYLLNPQIIGAEDDYFDYQQEQISGQCSCFQSIDSLKGRPAHLAVFLHHVVSQFDPAPLLCYLYADMHKQTSSKETRRFFLEFHSLFVDRSANLKVQVPETVAAELEKRRLELIPEELCRQYTLTIQEALLSDLHVNLEDFRQKRSMGLTLAEDELSRLDSEREKEQPTLEKECSCAERILSKIEDILMTSQPTEEEKCQTMQYVILTYMKHLGVKVKEPREHKRGLMNFLPKIKVKRPEKHLLSQILNPPRRLSKVDSTSVGKAVELNKQRSPKLPQSPFGVPDLPDSSAAVFVRNRANQLSEGSDTSTQSVSSSTSVAHSPPTTAASDTSGPDSDSNLSPICLLSKPAEALLSSDHHESLSSPTSTQFDFSAPTLEQRDDDQEPFSRMDVQCAASSADTQSEDDQGGEPETEEDPLNWQRLVSRGVLASLTPKEIKRQEVINELFYTERAHLRMLRVMDSVFCQRLSRDAILPPEDVKQIFVNLEEIIQMHVSITEHMAAIRKRSETSVIGQIGDDLLSWFSGEEEEKMKRAVGTFCSNQPSALELIKTKKKKDQRFNLFMQEAESNRLCRRLQLKDIIPVEMQRVTKYPLLLANITKYTDEGEERDKVRKAGECCKKILNHVNQAVKEAENKQRLEEYQRRLDLSSLKQSENPLILELKNLDLTKKKMVHEGPLSWKVNKDKTIELYTLLLEDIMVLLQKQDERLVLKLHGKNLASIADLKNIFSPVIKLNTVLVRPVATDNKSFFVLSMSENGAQIYELTAQTVTDQRMWQYLITQSADSMKAKSQHRDSPGTQTEAERDVIEIMNSKIPKASAQPDAVSNGSISTSDKEASLSLDVQAPVNPFDCLKSEDEEEELTAADRQEEEDLIVAERQEEEELSAMERREEEEEEIEEVDEAELEAFLNGQLAERLLQESAGSRQGIAIQSEESMEFSFPTSKAEEALHTLATLRQILFTHLRSREEEEGVNRPNGAVQMNTSPASSACEENRAPEDKENPQLPSAPEGLLQTAEQNGGFMMLDCGGCSDESTAEDDADVDVGIDIRKLLSSSSQAGGSGPNLSRQLMTYLRLLQADLQHLKEVEMKYKELRQIHGDVVPDSDSSKDGLQ
ncbi:rho guanine nucleotide exchange factor 12 isoform X1 [Oryzias melastigma]|uniref:Rho guanine nucleotide exchange factor 12-like n=2 Tax=Oryzias melastigma TaxID=30732 RepID=A0A3B3B650_ORYME|nr:rho guanine nucleotide exchange factor 12 isoform X1 [Oryzias melastigma]